MTTIQALTLTVLNTDDPPSVVSGPFPQVRQGEPFTYQLTIEDPDPGADFAVDLPDLPSWVNLSVSTSRTDLTGFENLSGLQQTNPRADVTAQATTTYLMTGTPPSNAVGSNGFTIAISDTVLGVISYTVAFTVANVPDAPEFVGTPTTGAVEDTPFVDTIQTQDADPDDSVTLTVLAQPGWITAVLSDAVGTVTLSGTPTNDDLGEHAVSLVVTDADGLTGTLAYSLTVFNAADVPFFTSTPLTTVNEDALYTTLISADDIDPDEVLSISLTRGPDWLSLSAVNNGNAILSGTPDNDAVGTHPITLTVSDNDGLTAQQRFNITVINTNDVPTFTTEAIVFGAQNVSYSYTITASDVDLGDLLTISLTTPYTWLVLSQTTTLTSFENLSGRGYATLIGQPSNGQVGEHAITLQVVDIAGAIATQSFTLTIANANDAPLFSSSPVLTATEDADYSYAIIATDPDLPLGDQLTISSLTPYTWLTLTDNGDGSASLSGVPGNDQVGVHPVTLEVRDAITGVAFQSFSLTVLNTNDPPTFTSKAVPFAAQGFTYTYHITASDVDQPYGDLLTITTLTPYTWLTLTDGSAGSPNGTVTLTGVPGNSEVGVFTIILQVADTAGLTATQSFTVAVSNTNDPPQFVSTPITTATQDVAYSYDITASDIDQSLGDQLTINSLTPYTWLTLTDNGDGTAALTALPTNDEVGVFTITLQVVDTVGLTDTQTFSLTVINVNDPPTITSEAIMFGVQGVTYTYQITATDPDQPLGDLLTMTTSTPYPWLTFSDSSSAGSPNGTALLVGLPTNAEVGPYSMSLLVTDSEGLTASQSFTVTIANTNDPPVFVSTPLMTATEDVSYTHPISVTDLDVPLGDSLTIISLTPYTWLTLTDNGDGTASLSGLPTNDEVGVYAITLQASDVVTGVVTQSFSLTVINVNDDPFFVSSPVLTATEEVTYTYLITTGDVDVGDNMTISTLTPFTWLTFTDNGGGSARLSGPPGNGQVGNHAITLQVTDLAGSTINQNYVLSVSNVNDAPFFVSTPPTDTLVANISFSAPITAQDVDLPHGDSLTLSSPTAPVWLTLTDHGDGTGMLSGAPPFNAPNVITVDLQVIDSGGLIDTQSFTMTVLTNGPAGVIQNLALWLKADAGVFNGSASTVSDGERVDQWHNQVSNSLVYVHQGTDASRPTWQNNQLNGNPVLTFNGSNDLIISQAADLPLDDQARTVIAVASDKSGDSNYRYIFSHGVGAHAQAHFIGQGESNDTLTYGGWTAAKLLHNNFWTNSTPHVVAGRYAGGTNGLVELFGAGVVLESNNYTWNTLEHSDPTFKGFVGRQVWGGASEYWIGDIAEIIVYTEKALTAPEFLRVHSYLALKYGIPLSGTNYVDSQDTTLWTMGGGYDSDIAGIGVDAAGGLSQLASRSVNPDSLVTITGTVANVTDGEFLIWGNDDGNLSRLISDGPASQGYTLRLSRTWKVAETGDTGPLTISFDQSRLVYTATNYVLLVDSDTILNDTTTVISGTVSGQTVTFSNVELADGQYFSLAYQDKAAPGGVIPNLALWLKADAGAFNASIITANDGETVAEWHNQVSNSLVYVHQGTDASRPTWQDHQLNGNPVLRFNGSNDLIISQADDLPLGDQARTVIAVASDTSGDSAFRYIMAHGEGAAVNAHFLGQDENTDTLNYGGWASTLLHNNFWTDNSPRVVTGRYAGGTNGLVELFGAGAVLNSNNFTWNTQENSHAAFKGFVGRQVWGNATAQAWLGDIAELIIYTDKALTDPEILRVHSYLALKYGLTLSGTNYVDSQDTTLWTMGGGYDSDIAGIGLDEASGLSQLTSRSMNTDSIVTLTGTVANVTDGEFLLWGNDGVATNTLKTDTPSGYTNRLGRAWQVAEIGETGSLSLSFDLAGLSDVDWANTSQFALLVDTDADFSNATAIPPSAVSTGRVTFSAIDLANGQTFSLAYPQAVFMPSLYDFSLLTPGNLNGQRGWVTTKHNTSTDVQVNATHGYDGSQAVRPIVGGAGVGGDGSLQAGNDLSLPIFTGPEIQVFEFDIIRNHWGSWAAIGYDTNSDGKITKSDTTEWGLAIRSVGGGGGNKFRLWNGSWNDGSTTAPTSWSKIRLVIDTAANSGQGSGSVYYKNPPDAASWQIVSGLQNVNLNLDTAASDARNPNRWDHLFFHFETNGGGLDNLFFYNAPDLGIAKTVSPVAASPAIQSPIP